MENSLKSWIGKNYHTGGIFELPILILGESVYVWNNEKLETSRIIELVSKNSTGSESHKFYTNIFLAFTQKERTNENKRFFWDSVAHFNYILTPVNGGPRTPPTPQMINDAKNALIGRINALDTQPTAIVVLGKRLWFNYLPKLGKPGPIIEDGANRHETRIVKTPRNKEILATWIYHPSSSFSSRHWHLILSKFITMAKQINDNQSLNNNNRSCTKPND